jgi:hypothetical protein
MAKNKLQILADELVTVLYQRAEVEVALKPIKDREEYLREELAVQMWKKGEDDVATSSGLSWHLNKGRVSFKIKKGMEGEALNWAMENYPSLLSLTAAKVNAVVMPMLNPPPFFDRVEGDPYIAISKTEK